MDPEKGYGQQMKNAKKDMGKRMREKYIDSSSRRDRLHLCIWMLDTTPQIIVQLTHGMVEHMGRYEELALYLNDHGIGVIGHDTLGHGKSAPASSQLGFFAKKNGDRCLVADVARVTAYIRKQYPGSRIVLIGHSMGSFVSRQYLTQYGAGIDGAILMGTGDPGRLKVAFAMAVTGFLRVLRGDFYRSSLINYLILDSNDHYFFDRECTSWLNSDQKEADRYHEDEYCGFQFTVSAYLDFFRILMRLAKNKETAKIPKCLPILFLSGKDDAIGEFTKGVRRVADRYKRAGIRDVSVKFYPGMRHEILHEPDRKQVQEDILDWIRAHFSE